MKLEQQNDEVRLPSNQKFWSLVELARNDFNAFTLEQKKMDRTSLIGNSWKFDEVASILYDQKYHKNRFSDDLLEDFTGWVIGCGQERYLEIIAHPELAPTKWDNSEIGMDIKYQAEKIYFDKYNDEMPFYDGI